MIALSVTITVIDEVLPGKALSQYSLTLPSSRMTVRKIIESRVTHEVETFNKSMRTTQQTQFNGLVQPTESERILNGFKMKKPRQIDCKAQVRAAVDAFAKNGYLILINDRQVGSLDEDVLVTQNTQVTFLKLIPLVGG